MAKPVRVGDRIDQATLERIIRRAAELQAKERDFAGGLSEEDLMALADEVGIPRRLLEQAMWEEKTAVQVAETSDFMPGLFGPGHVYTARTIVRDAEQVSRELHYWMTKRELLAVRRRFPDATSWEPRDDLFTTIRQVFDTGGSSYSLSKTKEVLGQVTPLEEGACRVILIADLTNRRKQRMIASGFSVGAGGAVAGTGAILGFALPVALSVLPVGMLIGYGVARSGRGTIEKVQVSLEQVLDRLEHREVKLPTSKPKPNAEGALQRIASEIKKNIR